MDPEDRTGVLVYGLLVVREPGPIRGADLAQLRAGELEHLGDPEPAPDLYQLAARDDDLGRVRGAGGYGREGEQRSPGAVVDYEGVLGACQLLEERHRVVVARAPSTGGEVVLQIRVAPGGLDNGLRRPLRQDRASQVRRSEEHTSELQSRQYLVCRLLLEKKK